MKIGVETKEAALKEAQLGEDLKTAGFWQCFMLGIGIAGGGISTSKWQFILLGGMWEGLISTFVCMIGYFMLDFSLSELVGIVPYGGGSFGFVRCSLGPLWGFMTACVEMVMYMIYTVRTIQKMTELVTMAADTTQSLEPLWALCFYVVLTGLHMRGGSLFWNTMLGCTVVTFLMLGLYIIGSLTKLDFHTYAMQDGRSNGFDSKQGDLYMEYAYLPMWFFMGICALPLAGKRVKDAHVNIPHAIMSGLTTMSIISIICVFCVAAQKPGIGPQLESVNFVLEDIFRHFYGIPQEGVVALLFVPTFASATGFFFACKHQMAAMAESGLMPQVFKQRFGPNQIPIYGAVFCALLQYVVYLVINHYLVDNVLAIFRLCCAAACVMYIIVMAAFIAFRYKYDSMRRHFVSPVGVPGAVVGIAIFTQILIGLVFFQSGNGATWIALIVFVTLMMIYYFAYVQYVQFFSKEEQDNFMKAYILNANKKRQTSQWVKLLTAFCVATGLDKFALRTSRRSKNRSKGSTASKSTKSSSNGSIDRSSVTSNPGNVPQVAFSVRNNKVDVEPAAREPDSGIESSQRQRGQGLRSSLVWSGKHFRDDNDSRKAFQLLHHAEVPEESDEEEEEEAAEVEDEEEELGFKAMSRISARGLVAMEEGEETDNQDINLMADLLVERFPEQFVATVPLPLFLPSVIGSSPDEETGVVEDTAAITAPLADDFSRDLNARDLLRLPEVVA